MSSLSPEDLDKIVAIERGCSAISLIGCLVVLLTFTFCSSFRQRAINRMVFYATFGNMLTNVATLMTRSFTTRVDSFGCQLQAFLIQVFMQGDAYWAMCMAINVYLTFYHKYDGRMLRRMEPIYWAGCLGVPLIPGLAFIWVSTKSQGRVYGNALLWCWIKTEWDVWRIASFYGPVWVSIIITITIYIRAGREIYKKRQRMLNFSSSAGGTVVGADSFFPYNEFSPAINFKTTEVVQTTEIIQPPPAAAIGGTSGIPNAPGPHKQDPNVSYTVTISADPANRQSDDDIDSIETLAPVTSNPHGLTQVASNSAGNVMAKVASTATQITILPGNVNPNTQAAMQAARRRNQYETHNATWSYCKCAMLFFLVLLITWVPSSANRVYSLVYNGAVSRELYYASAFVLPLQGFWNGIIYIVTSWSAFKVLCYQIMSTVQSLWPWQGGMSCFGQRRVSIVEITDIHGHGGKAKQMSYGRTGRAGASGSQGANQVGVMWGNTGKNNSGTSSMEDLTNTRERLPPV